MAGIERAAIHEALKQKGFEVKEKDHTFFHYYSLAGEKSEIFTFTSHGTGHKVIGDNLVSKMSRQCKLTIPQFRQFVTCTLSREQYEQVLIDAKIIPAPPSKN